MMMNQYEFTVSEEETKRQYTIVWSDGIYFSDQEIDGCHEYL